MSEEKLYVVKNNDGEYWDFNDLGGFWKLNSGSRTVTVSEDDAKKKRLKIMEATLSL